ncbi:hypothetical protein, partial [Klebsiella pneumoniae]
SERIPAAAGIVNLRYKSCPEMAGQDQNFSEWKRTLAPPRLRFTIIYLKAAIYLTVHDKM